MRKLQGQHGISHVTFESAVAIEKAVLAAGGVDTRPVPKPKGDHPLAGVFPLMVGAELDALIADIGENGLNEPIVVFEGQILDGRNRERACKKAGVEPRYVEFDSSRSPIEFVISANIKRRHLDQGQLAAVAANIATMTHGGVRVRRGEQVATLPLEVAQKSAASLVGVSPRVVTAATAVKKKGDPCVFEALMEGRVGAMRAAEIVALPAEDQRFLVSKMSKDDIVKNHERIKKDQKREETFKRINEQASASPAWPEGRYSVIYADPPTEDDFGHTKKDVELHYPTMSWDDLKALPVEEIATEDAVLYLWSAPHVIHKMLEVMARWGFEYRTHIVWVKDKIGLGQWCRNQHEVLLIGRRGDFPPPPEAVRTSSAITGPPVGEHSEKPEIVSEMIERWYPTASKVELFRRGGARPGWAVYGFEALVDAL